MKPHVQENAPEHIALFDLDGTLCDYHGQMTKDLNDIACPDETPFAFEFADDDTVPLYIRKRISLIRNQPGWWERLQMYAAGKVVYDYARKIGFKIVVLTKGPWKTLPAWTEKARWVRTNLDADVQVTITEDKGLVYGKVLVDDYPDYIIGWLKYRPRGLVIMPAHPYNAWFKHPNVIRFDANDPASIAEMEKALRAVYKRNAKEPLTV